MKPCKLAIALEMSHLNPAYAADVLMGAGVAATCFMPPFGEGNSCIHNPSAASRRVQTKITLSIILI